MSKPGELNIVDENDKTIGEDTRENIHKKGLLHREIHVWIYNQEGEVLFQKRSLNKDTFPGLLDASVGGHVEQGESYQDAAIKETKEETGIKIDNGKLIFIKKIRKNNRLDKKTGSINNVFWGIYVYQYNGNVKNLILEKGKAISLEFWPIDKILKLSKNDKDLFLPILDDKEYLEVFKKIKELINSKK